MYIEHNSSNKVNNELPTHRIHKADSVKPMMEEFLLINARRLFIDPNPAIGINNATKAEAKLSFPNKSGPKIFAVMVKVKNEELSCRNLAINLRTIEKLNDEASPVKYIKGKKYHVGVRTYSSSASLSSPNSLTNDSSDTINSFFSSVVSSRL